MPCNHGVSEARGSCCAHYAPVAILAPATVKIEQVLCMCCRAAVFEQQDPAIVLWHALPPVEQLTPSGCLGVEGCKHSRLHTHQTAAHRAAVAAADAPHYKLRTGKLSRAVVMSAVAASPITLTDCQVTPSPAGWLPAWRPGLHMMTRAWPHDTPSPQLHAPSPTCPHPRENVACSKPSSAFLHCCCPTG